MTPPRSLDTAIAEALAAGRHLNSEGMTILVRSAVCGWLREEANTIIETMIRCQVETAGEWEGTSAGAQAAAGFAALLAYMEGEK